MAVSDFNAPSLAPSYQNITQQLQNRASLELKRPSPLDAVTQTVSAVADREKLVEQQKFEIGKAYLQHSFDTALQKQRQDFEKRGEVVVDEDTIRKAKDEFGVDIANYRGITVSPEKLRKEIEAKIAALHNKKIQDIMNDPTLTMEQKRTKVLGEAIAGGEIQGVTGAAAKGAFNATKAGQAKVGVDATSSTGYRYFQAPTEEGSPWTPGVEAPPPAGSVTKPKAASESDRTKAEILNTVSTNYQQAIDNYSPGFVGPYDSRAAAVKQYTPFASDKAANFLSGVAGLQNTKLHQLYGSRLTSTEVGRYALEGPDTHKNEKDFLAKLYKQAKSVNRDIAVRQKSMQEGNLTGIPDMRPVEIPLWLEEAVNGKKKTTAAAAPTEATDENKQAAAVAWAHAHADSADAEEKKTARGILALHPGM